MSDEEPRTIIEREFDSPGPQHRINLINDIHRLKFQEPGNYSIMARAYDESGRIQPVTEWNYLRKHFDGVVPSEVTVED